MSADINREKFPLTFNELKVMIGLPFFLDAAHRVAWEAFIDESPSRYVSMGLCILGLILGKTLGSRVDKAEAKRHSLTESKDPI